MNIPKLIGPASSAASKAGWLSRVFSGAKTFLSGTGKFMGGPWVNAAFLGWAVYDFFASSSTSDDAGAMIADISKEADLKDVLYPRSILRGLNNEISDSDALVHMMTDSYLKAINSADPLARYRASVYLVAADYFRLSPDLSNIIYSPNKTSDLLKELSEVMEVGTQEEQAQFALSPDDVASAPVGARRVLDFTAHYCNTIKSELEASHE